MTTSEDVQEEQSSPAVEVSAEDEKLLQEIRDRYDQLAQLWREIREERQKDLRYLCGDVWEEEDKRARKEAGRPCINQDELNQYVNQAVNSARQNRRGIKVEPDGNGSNAKTADFRQQLIRGIEYKSKAQSVYLRGYQDMVEGSYGYCRIGRRYVSDDIDGPDDQEITINAVLNPDSILFGFDTAKQPDWSDARDCFELEPISREEFKRRWPEAKIQDFSAEHFEIAKDWIHEKDVLTAAYWRVESKFVWNRRKTRKVAQKTLVQYWTNGVEILERSEQPGKIIPIIPFIGLARYVDEGGGSKLKLFSLTRLARDPQMSLAYLCSQQMEEAGLSPKTPYIGYVGQFETDAEAWQTATKIAHAYLQVDPIPDGANNQVLPLPQRVPFTPNFQAYEVAKDSARRGIQAAMGIAPLPTAAQRANQKSGIALEKIQDQENIGSYHFVDGYDRALELAGKIIESWIDVTYDTERDVALRKPDDTHQVARVNTDEPYIDPTTQPAVHYPVADQGDHSVTISTGPSYQSQREEAAEFTDTLVEQLPLIAQISGPPAAAKLLSLAIQMRELGPKGDEMAEIIAPTSPDKAAQLGQQLGAMQQQVQQGQQIIQQLQAELQKLQLEKQGKLIDNQARMTIEKMKIDAQIAMAEVNTKAQQLNERMAFIQDIWKQLHQTAADNNQQVLDQQHQQQMQAMDQAHERQLASQQQQAAAQQAALQQQQEGPSPQ